MATRSEQRSGVRIPLDLPAQLSWKTPGGQRRRVRGQVADMSGNGLLFLTESRLGSQAPFRCTLTLPSAITSAPTELVCRGQIVREAQPGDRYAYGALIRDYELRPLKNAPQTARG